MNTKRWVAFFSLLFLFFTTLPTNQHVFASIPSKIDALFYSDIQNSSKEEKIIIKFRKDCTVTYSTNDITPLSPISLDDAYRKEIKKSQLDWVQQMQKKVPFQLLETYQNVYNGVAINIKGYNIRYILKDPAVEKIFDTRSLNYISRQFSVSTISAKPVWNLENSKKEKITGKGIKIGVLDTGIDYFHPDFLDQEGKTSRIKGGKDFADNDEDYYDSGSEKDKPGFVPHGTHVAGITSGNNLANPLKKGMAYESDLFVYKVFSNERAGANYLHVVAAIDQSVVDKCHVINLSLGNTTPVPSIDPGNPYYDSILNAMKAGVMVVCAAGNEGSRNTKNPFSIHAPGTYEPSIQVAGSDDRMNAAIVLKSKEGSKQLINCKKFIYAPPFQSNLIGTKIVDCGFGSPEDFAKVNVEGKIAWISRGPKGAGISFQEKNLNAKKAKAIAAITYNYDEDALNGTLVPPSPDVDPYAFDFIPNLQMSGANAFLVKKILENGGTIEVPTNTNLSLYDMSSTGPCYSGDDNVFKPEICAPGKQVNSAVMSGKDTEGKVTAKYEDWDGTSMATPHATGAIALVRQAHPEWNSYDIKAVVMNTADIITNQISGQPFSFFMQGSGQINALSAIQSPTITSPPSLQRNISKLENSYEFEIKNTTSNTIDAETSFEFFGDSSIKAPVEIKFDSSKFSIPKGEKKKISVSFVIDEENFINRRYEGVLWIRTGKVKNHVPIILFKGKLADLDKPISSFTLSESTIDIKNPSQHKINFSINNGSRLIVKGVEPEVDQTSNHADSFKIFVTDSKKNKWGTIFFAENLFLGTYSFDWNGLDIYGNEIIPNGNYFLMAEISGLKATVETGKETIREEMPETSELIPILVKESSIPTPPLLIVAAPDKLEIDKEFVLEILFADSQDIDEVQLKLTWSKSSVNSIGYQLGNFVDETLFDEKKNAMLKDGEFTISVKRNSSTDTLPRLKIASIRLMAEKATGKSGLLTTVELVQIKDKKGNIRKTLLNYPLINVLKTNIEFGDFNNDGFINKADLDLLLAMDQKTYLDLDWDEKFDLNHDLVVDVVDFAIFGKYYTEE